ncbi:hypothetical protein [Candidatus Protochlamydia phocaeensis]|uniref:hypothetical protein n=1 Tax=Candidatus Protochlamydia phocaeensis TaxID=1414722 RepID=UPI0008391F01|nr:hypothetical protein [Candidatus Protochlamydia phocaeensis]
MKYMKILFLILFSLMVGHMQAEEKAHLSDSQKKVLESLHLKEIKLEQLADESRKEQENKLGDSMVADVKERSSVPPAATGVRSLFSYPSYLIVTPIYEELSFIDGAPCHVGHYSHFSLITVLEGINWGCQLRVAYDGAVLSIKPFNSVDFTPGGMIFRHEYFNSTVVTGANQVIYLF